MTPEELEIRKFELEQRVKLEELELRKKEFDLKIQEQRSKRISTPLVLSILGGLITIITGITLNYFDSQSKISLEDKKFQSSLLLKATDAESYEEFSNMLVALQENGLLSLDSLKVANFRKNRLIAEETKKILHTDSTAQSSSTPNPDSEIIWTIVAGGDSNLKGAQYEKSKAKKNGFETVEIWFRRNSYRTCIGEYSSNTAAINDLFEIKERINPTSYIVRLDQWCPNATYDYDKGLYYCN